MFPFRTVLSGLIFSGILLLPTGVFAVCGDTASCAVPIPASCPPPAGSPAGTSSNCGAGQPCRIGGTMLCISERDLCILEPIPGSGIAGSCISASETANLGAFLKYVNSGVWTWAFSIGIALAVLNGTIGSLQIVLSGGDSGKVEAGKTRFIWSAVGLILLLLSGVILQFLNPKGFVNL